MSGRTKRRKKRRLADPAEKRSYPLSCTDHFPTVRLRPSKCSAKSWRNTTTSSGRNPRALPNFSASTLPTQPPPVETTGNSPAGSLESSSACSHNYAQDTSPYKRTYIASGKQTPQRVHVARGLTKPLHTSYSTVQHIEGPEADYNENYPINYGPLDLCSR